MQNIKVKSPSDQGCHTGPKGGHLKRWMSLYAMLCAALTLSACASLGGGTPEEQVRQRATERWQALVAGQFSRAYTYNTPGFRAVVSPDAYRNRFGGAVTWLGAEVIRVNCSEAGKCIADLRINFKPLLRQRKVGDLETGLSETWLLEDGQWWFFQKI